MMTKEELNAPMKKLIIVLLATMALGIGIGIGFLANNNLHPAGQNKASYELQQKCTKDAEDFVIKARAGKIPGALFGLGEGEKQRVDMLQHHYSARLNKCFVKLHTKNWWVGNGKENADREQLGIWDVNDYERGYYALFRGWPTPKQSGTFTVDSCWAINPHDLGRSSVDWHFDRCDTGYYIPIPDLESDTPPKWEALIKPYMEE
jgi:hypothetical protein